MANRQCARMMCALALSRAGDFLYSVALTVVLMQQTGSLSWVGLAWLARLVPPALLSPFAGALGDRFERRVVLVVSDVARGVLIGGLALGV